jgi:serine phosphatase RsbU (regulator of sigma subunit)
MGEGQPPRALGGIAVQVAIAITLGVAFFFAYAALRGDGSSHPLIAAAVATSALLAAELSVSFVDARWRRWRDQVRSLAGEGQTTGLTDDALAEERVIDELAEACMNLRSETELAETIDELFARQLGLGRAGLLVAREPDRWQWVSLVDDGGGDEVTVERALVAHFAEHEESVWISDLGARPADELRAPIEALLAELGVDVLIPILDRDRLLGAMTATLGRRRPTAAALGVLPHVQQAASRTLTYLELLREAEQQVGVAREGEVAAAVQHAAAPGMRDHAGEHLSITSYYQPADAFGGDFFSAAELADGRTFVAIGDVAGRGMPAALISAAVAGACEAAERLIEPGTPIVEIVDHFNRLVGAVGRDRYAMSCFFALFEPDASAVTFADAGHPFPYVCRAREGGGTDLRALVARGVPLGLEPAPRVEVVRTELEEGDAIVLFTDALVEALAPGTEAPYGDRRLRRLLRRRAAHPRLCREIVDDVLEYCGPRPLHDDMTVAVVRIGAAPRASAARR